MANKKQDIDLKMDIGDFAAKQMKSNANDVLGGLFNLSPSTRLLIEPLIDRLTVDIAKYGSHWLAGGLKQVFIMAGVDETKATLMSQSSQKVLQYALPFWSVGVSAAKQAKQYWDGVNDLNKKVAPVIAAASGKAGVGSLLMSENEILIYERQRLSDRATKNFGNIAVKALPIAAQSLASHYDQQASALMHQHDLKTLDALAAHSPEGKRLVSSLGAVKDYGVLGASAVGEIVKEKAFGDEKDGKKSVITLISDLKEYVDGMLAKGDKDSGAAAKRAVSHVRYQVEEIFRQHNKNMGREIPERYSDEFNKAVSLISEAICEGDIDTLALFNLVGEKKIIRSDESRVKMVVDSEGVEAELEHQRCLLPQHCKVDVEAFFEEAPFGKKDLAEAFKTLQGKERAFMAAMFDDQVLLEVGLKQDEINDMRKDIKDDIYMYVKKAINAVNDMSYEEKKAHGLTSHEIDSIESIARDVEKHGLESLKNSMKRDKPDGVKAILRNGLIGEAGRDGALWTKIVGSNKKRDTSLEGDRHEHHLSDEEMEKSLGKHDREREKEHDRAGSMMKGRDTSLEGDREERKLGHKEIEEGLKHHDRERDREERYPDYEKKQSRHEEKPELKKSYRKEEYDGFRDLVTKKGSSDAEHEHHTRHR